MRFDPEELIAQAGWLRALALRLTADPHAADDLSQQTLAAALEHPPEEEGSPRGWLASVLRNFLRQDARGEERRARRELGAARPEEVPSTLELVERTLAAREVA